MLVPRLPARMGGVLQGMLHKGFCAGHGMLREHGFVLVQCDVDVV